MKTEHQDVVNNIQAVNKSEVNYYLNNKKIDKLK